MTNKDIGLRALEPEDLGLLYEWENNESNWLISNTITPFSKYVLKQYLRNSHKSIYETGQLRLMIDYLPESQTVGTIDIFDFDPFHRRAGIGILVAKEMYRRKGIGTMALECIVGYAEKTLQLHQLYCNILSNNRESIELFNKHGFVQAGLKKDWVRIPGGFLDEYIFQLKLND